MPDLWFQVLHRSRRGGSASSRRRSCSVPSLDFDLEGAAEHRPEVPQVRLQAEAFARSEEAHSPTRLAAAASFPPNVSTLISIFTNRK